MTLRPSYPARLQHCETQPVGRPVGRLLGVEDEELPVLLASWKRIWKDGACAVPSGSVHLPDTRAEAKSSDTEIGNWLGAPPLGASIHPSQFSLSRTLPEGLTVAPPPRKTR